MMTMARGLRLGIMCSNRKRKRSSNSNSNYYDDEGDESSWLLEKGKGKVKKKRSKKKKNDDDDDLLTRKRKRNDIYYDDVESTKQQQQLKNTSGRKKRTSNFRLNKCSTGFKNQEGSSHMDILLNKAQAQPQFEPQVLQSGATLNLSDLFFTKHKDFLVTYNDDGRRVVPVHTLEDKVVALYFYFHYHKDPDNLTKKLKMAYEQWAKEGNFEIVLVYIHNSPDSGMIAHEAESTFSSIFRQMPWLALPFKDPKCLTLQRIFNFPDVIDGPWPDPRLLIVGPQGKFFEQCGADILKEFGISAYPFTRQRAAQLEAESVRKLDLSTFWDPNAPFIQQDGTEVKLSQLVGKRIMVVIEGMDVVGDKFWQKLNARYLQMKDTNNEFEVIYISRGYGSSNDEHVTSCSWLRHPPIRQGSQIQELFWSLSLFGKYTGLLAFDRDGRVVRKTVFPSVEKGNMVFRFYAGGLEKDALRRLIKRYWTNRY